MPVFAYRGRNARGDLVTGTLEGADAGAVADQLMNTGVTPVEITGSAAEGAAAPEWWRRLTAPAITDLDVMLFSRQMHTLLKAGVPIMQALVGLQESTSNATLKELIRDLRASLDSGRELSAALRRHPEVFGNFYVSVVRVGETTGQLDESFDRLYRHLEFEREIRERIKTALRYPAIVIVVIAAAVAIVNWFVIPAFAKVFANAKVQLPLLTRFLIATSDFFVDYWYVIAAIIAALVFGFRAWTRTEAGRYSWDRMKLRLPIAGKTILKATLARFSRSMAIATQAGVPIVQGLTTVADTVDNAHLALRIRQMRDGVERGESVARTAAAAGVFTPVVLQMVAVGEETGEFDSLLMEVAQMYEREVDYEVRNLSAAIEPVLTVALGVLVTILAIGVFLPMWEMASVMTKKG